MKNVMKKMLSAALSGCMALSAMGGISAMAAGTEDADLIVFEDNFEDSSNISLKQGDAMATWTEEPGTANHYVHHGDTWAPYAIGFDRPVSTTKFTVQYDFYYDGKSAAVFVGDLDGMASKDVASSTTMTIMYVSKDKIVAFNDNNPGEVYTAADGTSEATLTPETWYSYSATLNTANRKMTATITERGKTDVVAALNDATCPYKAANMANNTWGGWAVAGTSYANLITLRNCNLDNVKVSEIPDPESPIVFEDNFEDSSNISLKTPGGTAATWTSETDTANHYVHHGDTWAPYAIAFDRPVSTTKFKVQYDFYYDGTSAAVFVGDLDGMGSTNAASSTTMTIMYVRKDTHKIIAFNDSNPGTVYKAADGTSEATLTSETWYSYSATLDTANRKMTATITERGKTDVVAALNDATCPYKAANMANNTWGGWAVAGTSYANLITLRNCNLDNVEVSEIHEAPVVTSVKFKDVHGNAMNNFTERVKSVDIAFSDKMDKSTMNADNISLTNNGSAVSYTGQLSGDRKTYTMTFDGISAGSAVLSMSNLKSAYYDMAEYSNTFKVLGKNSLFEEDFEAYDVQDEYPYVHNTVQSEKPYVSGNSNNKYMNVEAKGDWGNIWAFDYTNAVPTANFNVQYDFYYGGNAIAVFTGDIKDYTARRKVMTLMFVNTSGNIYALNDGSGEFVFKAEDGSNAILARGWYTYSASLDTKNRRIAATIVNRDSGAPVGSLDATCIYKDKLTDGDEQWFGWAMEGTEYKNLAVMFDARLDNIKVEYNPNSIDALTITEGETTTTVNSFADIKDGKWKVNLSTENTDGVTAANVVIAAIYDADGKLLDALTKPAELSAYYLGSKEVDFGNVTLPEGAASVKIMYWNGLDKCNPLTQGINF